MSEIKGQILGVVLVLAIFGAIAAIMVNFFKTTAQDLETKVSDNIDNAFAARNSYVVDANLTF